eukprot:4207116-Prorocentrum_lima.AAC.1
MGRQRPRRRRGEDELAGSGLLEAPSCPPPVTRLEHEDVHRLAILDPNLLQRPLAIEEDASVDEGHA